MGCTLFSSVTEVTEIPVKMLTFLVFTNGNNYVATQRKLYANTRPPLRVQRASKCRRQKTTGRRSWLWWPIVIGNSRGELILNKRQPIPLRTKWLGFKLSETAPNPGQRFSSSYAVRAQHIPIKLSALPSGPGLPLNEETLCVVV